MDSTYKWLLTNTLVLFNVLMKIADQVGVFTGNAVKAIQNSYIPDMYIFRERNSIPWVVKKGSVYTSIGCALEYSVNEKMFYAVSSSESAPAKMDDIVMAELVDSSGSGVCDMSEFFHSVRWSCASSASSEEAPSLYEMVLMNLLANNKIVCDKVLSSYVLNVITIDNPSLTLPLSSEAAKKPFLGWNCCHPTSPSPPLNEASI